MLSSSPRLLAALSAAFMLLGGALSLPQEEQVQDPIDLIRPRPIPPCPTCYTSTVWLPPPCAPPPTTCTGPSTPPLPRGCTSTIDLRPTTYTIPGVNPACPSTPSVISALPCPTIPACYAHKCSTVILGPTGTDAGVKTTITQGPMRCRVTGGSSKTSTTTLTTTRGMWDATLSKSTRTPPPPKYTLPPPPVEVE